MALRQALPLPSLLLMLQASGLGVESAQISSQNLNLFLGVHGEDAQAAPPMPPSMRCVTLLTALYFGTYLAIILARWKGMIFGSSQNPIRIRGRLSLSQTIESSVTDALTLAPMLCILMIGARLRAMQLDPEGPGHPQPWAMSMMYVSTWAFIVQFVAKCLAPFVEEYISDGQGGVCAYSIAAIRITGMVVLYCGFTAIVASLFMIEAPPPHPTPPLSAAMHCVTVMTTVYFTIYLCIGTLQTVQQCRSMVNQVDARLQKLENKMEHATTALQFAPMLCVLAVAIRLRSLQHGQEPQAWAQAAMYVATWTIVVQTVLLLMVPYLLPVENLDADEETRGLDWGKHEHPTLKGLAICISSVWWLAVISLYACIIVIIAGVFIAEPDPGHIFVPEVKDRPAAMLLQMSAAPAVSTAMRCVTVLTLLYFTVFLCILLCRAAKGDRTQRRLEAFSDIAKQGLAFAPMMCIMMIGMRLRAVQLGYHDPQTWAQHTMWIGTTTIIVQVAIAVPLVLLQPDEDDEDEETAVCKASRMVLLILRFVALFGVYLAMVVLIVALFAMEPNPLHPLHIKPELDTLGPSGLMKNHPS